MTGDNSSLPNNNSTQCSHWTPLQQHHRSTAAVAQLLCDGRDAVTCDAMRPGLVLVLCLGLGLSSVSAQGGFFSNILNRFNPFRQPQQPARHRGGEGAARLQGHQPSSGAPDHTRPHQTTPDHTRSQEWMSPRVGLHVNSKSQVQ